MCIMAGRNICVCVHVFGKLAFSATNDGTERQRGEVEIQGGAPLMKLEGWIFPEGELLT